MPIDTFNYCHFMDDSVKGEIRKNTLSIKGICMNNKLAPNFQNFSMNMPQTNALVLVKTDKSEYSSLTSSLVFDKICQVSFDTILFIERMNMKFKQCKKTLKGIHLRWFRTTSNKLLKGLFVYPKM